MNPVCTTTPNDFSCDQDQGHLDCITKDRWNVTTSAEQPEQNWLLLGKNLVICILPRVTCKIINSSGGFLLSGTRSLIVSLLRASEHEQAISFMKNSNEFSNLPAPRLEVKESLEPEPEKKGGHKRKRRRNSHNVKCKVMVTSEQLCGLKFDTRGAANRHMQIDHALWPEDTRLYTFFGVLYPCRFKLSGEDPCEFRRFRFLTSANDHMQSSHGVPCNDDRLYSISQHRIDRQARRDLALTRIPLSPNFWVGF